MTRRPVLVLLACLLAVPAHAGSLRFHGKRVGDIGRVKIAIDAPPRPADIDSDFTLKFWMKASSGENEAGSCISGNDGWIAGTIIFDRDVQGGGDLGDYGISLFADGLAFGVAQGGAGEGLCGGGALADGQWHHIAAVRRRTDGWMALFVDGALAADSFGPTGDIGYRDGRETSWPDEVRIPSVVRHASGFTRPASPFAPDPSTVALYHFDAGSGDTIHDVSGAAGGPSPGIRRFGGSPAGLEWSVGSFSGGTTSAPRPLPDPTRFVVHPQPARATTRLEFALSSGGSVRLRLFDVLGRHSRTLHDAPLPAGSHSVPRDLEDDAGRPVVPGFYRAELVLEGRTVWRSVIVIR